jgi:hypothetical protein
MGNGTNDVLLGFLLRFANVVWDGCVKLATESFQLRVTAHLLFGGFQDVVYLFKDTLSFVDLKG